MPGRESGIFLVRKKRASLAGANGRRYTKIEFGVSISIAGLGQRDHNAAIPWLPALRAYGAGWVTVFWSSVTPVWASSLPSIEAPVFMSIDV
jgi:hypothetical protein